MKRSLILFGIDVLVIKWNNRFQIELFLKFRFFKYFLFTHKQCLSMSNK